MNPDLTALLKQQYGVGQKNLQTLSGRLDELENAKRQVMPEALKRVGLENRVQLEDPSARISALLSMKGSPYAENIEAIKVQSDILDKLKEQIEGSQEEKMSAKDRLSLEIQAREKGLTLTTDENGRLTLGDGTSPEEQKKEQAKEEVLSLISEIDKADLGGVTGTLRLRSGIKGTKSYDTARKVEQLKSKLALNARELVKGSGAISDFEVRMLQEAATALDPGMSEAGFRAELKKIRSIIDGTFKGSGESVDTALDDADEALIKKYKNLKK